MAISHKTKIVLVGVAVAAIVLSVGLVVGKDYFAAEDTATSETALNYSTDAVDLRALNDQLATTNKITDAEQLIEKRKALIEKLMASNSDLTGSLLTESKVKKLPKSIREKVEQPKKLTGKIEAYFSMEATDSGVTETRNFTLVNGETKTPLYFSQDIDSVSEGTVSLEGVTVNDKFVVTGGNTAGTARTPQLIGAANAASSNENMIIILARHTNSPTTPIITKSEAVSQIINGPMATALKESSYDKVTLSGEATDWLTLTDTCNAAGGFNYYADNFIPLADTHVNFANFSRVLMIVDQRPCRDSWVFSSGTFGKQTFQSADGQFSASFSVISNTNFLKEVQPPVTTEPPYFTWTSGMGTAYSALSWAYGVPHYLGLECVSEVISSGCKNSTFGSHLHGVGAAWNDGKVTASGLWPNRLASFTHSAYGRYKAGWLANSDVATITQPNTYRISAVNDSSGKRLALIYPPSSPSLVFSVERLLAKGIDARLSGQLSNVSTGGLIISVHNKNGFGEYGRGMLDMTPTTQGLSDKDWYDVALLPGKSFNDPSHGVAISDVQLVPGGNDISFKVGFPAKECVRIKPTVFNDQLHDQPVKVSKAGVALGTVTPFWLSVKNADGDSCGLSDLTGFISGPSDWTLSETRISFSGSLPPGAGTTQSTKITQIPSNTPTGMYEYRVTVRNATSGQERIRVFPFQLTD